ncbi:MAG: CooT family nickel-binding protein [Chloroflexota bacterium]
MCQIAVYLDDEKIMDSVMLVDIVPDGVQLIKMFESPRVIPAVIRQIDLMKNKLILETLEQDKNHERDG